LSQAKPSHLLGRAFPLATLQHQETLAVQGGRHQARLELDTRAGNVVQPPRRTPLQTAPQQVADLRRSGWRQRLPVRLVSEHRAQRVAHGAPLEPRQPLRIAREDLRQNFDGYVASQLGVLRPVDLAHTTGADFFQDALISPATAWRFVVHRPTARHDGD